MCHAEEPNHSQIKEEESAMKLTHSEVKHLSDRSPRAVHAKAQRAAPGDRKVYTVDLAKEHFHLNVYSAHGELLSSKGLSRQQFEKRVSDPQRARGMWVMEACAGAHGWGRKLLALGDQVKLVPPQFVAKQRIGNKNDCNDAAAIFAVHLDARVHPVPVKGEVPQGQLAIHGARQLLKASRTKISNHLRSLLAEHLYVTAKGARALKKLVSELSEIESAAQLNVDVQVVLASLQTMLKSIDEQLALLDDKVKRQVTQSPIAMSLIEAPGIGPITASAMAAEYAGGVARFSDSRQFAANLGLTPGEHSSGGKTRMGGITKRGNAYLRQLLVQGAQGIVTSACPKPNSKRGLAQEVNPNAIKQDDLHVFARDLHARKPRHVVVIAVANRMARMVYAMLKSKAAYRPQRDRTKTKVNAVNTMPGHAMAA